MFNQGEYLRKLRHSTKLTQRELASLLNTSKDYISMLENNRKRVSDNYRIKYFNVFKELGINVSLSELFLNTLKPFESQRLIHLT